MSAEHRAYLKAEGLAEEFIVRCGTLRYSQAGSIAGKIVQQFGEEIACRHPALLKVIAGSRSWWTIAGASDGLLFPAFSHTGIMLGIQLRKDRPQGRSDRYRWLSHGGLGGTPLSVFRVETKAQNSHHLIITEGFKKAAVASHNWQCHAISLAGVTAYRETELIEIIQQLAVSGISLAFDRDKHQNPRVREAEQKLLRLLAATFPQISLFSLNWDMPHSAVEETNSALLLPPSQETVFTPDPLKGLDDALKADAVFRFDLAISTGPRFVPALPPEALALNFGTATPLFTVEQARRQHRAILDRKIRCPDGTKTVITSTTGTGKSQAADEALATALLESTLEHRVLLVCPTKENIRERTRPDTLLGQAVAQGLAVIQRGRRLIDLNAPPASPEPEDCANPLALQAGSARHAAARFVCRDCPFGSEVNWQKAFPGQLRPFHCEIDGYLASRKLSRQARVVIATKEAYLNNSHELGRFEVVICDEELLPYLLESGITVDGEVLRGWREKIALTALYAPEWQKLLGIIETTLDTLSREEADCRAGRLVNAWPYLEQAALAVGEDLRSLAAWCQIQAAPPIAEMMLYEAFHFETPYRHNAKLNLPYRAAAALLRALTEENAGPPYAVKGPDGSFRLEIIEVRGHLVELLRHKTLVVLDSTVPPQLKMLFPELQEQHYAVPQHQWITQITGALYSKGDLYKATTRANISRAIRAFAGNGEKHLTVVPLRFEEGEEALELPESGQVEHWGLHRATNRFAGLDSLALVGHHLRPLDRIEAEVKALKAFLGEEQGVAQDSVQPRYQKLRLYNHLDRTGRSAGLWRQCHSDPAVQAAIEHDYASHIIQAIGRLRTALRSEQLPPARILILCNEPVGDLKIDELTTTGKIAINPAEKMNFSCESYEESSKNQGVVHGETKPDKERDSEPEMSLLQEETVDTQVKDPFWEDLPIAWALT
ncbi:MAG: DUF3854 domain-containing protein [Chloroflexi bacterium]|uniref:DUF3854 domain-containing protein n=1 Tax=Candidatus Chlorohelix allophototropha TaxID=3003348 RepID=A0A8T7M4Q5_9CHLR|nr:DUF3854 domain-containing protein [Chloroflexota bacterium]WJW70391.1 DUF3854 domain-containing protein [Chloroflexota bacterium L227-S17]